MPYHEPKDPETGVAKKHREAALKAKGNDISNAEVKPTPTENVIENLKRIVKS